MNNNFRYGNTGQGRPRKYPFAEMDVGETHFEQGKPPMRKLQKRLTASASRFGVFTTRQTFRKGQFGVSVTRVA